MKMRRLWWMACLAVPCIAQEATGDIAAVRATYDKVVIANKIALLTDHINAEGHTVVRPAVSFALSEFKSGPVSEILSTNIAELLSKPSGLVLQSTLGHWTAKDSQGTTAPTTMLSVMWRTAGYLSEDWNVPFSRALDQLPPGYTRYVSFAVVVGFDGNQRSYRAMLLFGPGDIKPLAIDHIVGFSPINSILNESLSVDSLALPQNARLPAVRSFLEWVKGASGCQIEPASGLCCGSGGGSCRLPAASLPRADARTGLGYTEAGYNDGDAYGNVVRPALSDPCSAYNQNIQQSPISNQDSQYHCSGNHSGTVSVSTSCTYTSPNPDSPPGSILGCNVHCHVQASPAMNETGFVYSTCHQTSSGVTTQDAYQHGAQCSGAAAGGVQACWFCTCSISFTFGATTLSNTSAFWNVNSGGSLTCN